MAQLTGVSVNRLEGGLGRRSPTADNVVALVASMPLVGLELAYGRAEKLLQLRDAQRLGVSAAFDAAHSLLIHHHLSELFRLSPDATCYLIPVACPLSAASAVEKLLPIVRTQKDIKGLGFVGFKDTLPHMGGLAEKLQATFIDLLCSENRYIDFVLLEGKGPLQRKEGKSNKALIPSTMPDLRTQKAPQVSVIIAQDPFIACQNPAYSNYAAVGSALGMLCVRKVHENLGSVNIQDKPVGKKGTQDYPLTDTEKNRWLQAALSDGTKIGGLSKKDLKILADKAYLYAASYEGYAGVFFNSAATCVEKTSDFAFIENNRTWNKMARLVRARLIPEVKGVVKKDAQTGFIKSTTLSRWQGLLNKALEQMVIDEEINGFQVYIDPRQYTDEDTPLKVSIQGVKGGVVHEFEVDLGYTRKLNNR